MHNINTFHFLLMFLIIGSTCLLLELLALTSRQYFLLMVYQITFVSLLICSYKQYKLFFLFRPINKINLSTRHDDLANTDLLIQPKLCELVNQYRETLSKFLDKQTKSVQVRPPSPWISVEIDIHICNHMK